MQLLFPGTIEDMPIVITSAPAWKRAMEVPDSSFDEDELVYNAVV